MKRERYSAQTLYSGEGVLTVKLDKSKSSRFTIRSKFDTESSACSSSLGGVVMLDMY